MGIFFKTEKRNDLILIRPRKYLLQSSYIPLIIIVLLKLANIFFKGQVSDLIFLIFMFISILFVLWMVIEVLFYSFLAGRCKKQRRKVKMLMK